MLVRSRGRCVLHPAPLTSRKLRSPQDLSRRRPLARPTPSGPPRRVMSASTTRPVRHSIPLPLSIVARPHEAGLIRSWRADSLAFVWLEPGITPCCKSRKSKNSENLAKVYSSMFSLLQGPVGSIRRPVVDLVRNDVVPHVAACRTHQRA